MTVQAKFKVTEVTTFQCSFNEKQPDGSYRYKEGIGNKIKFNVVSSDKPENETFAQWTPTGELIATIVNPALVGHFTVGTEYIFSIDQAPIKSSQA